MWKRNRPKTSKEIILVIQNLPTKKSPKGFTGQFYEIKK